MGQHFAAAHSQGLSQNRHVNQEQVQFVPIAPFIMRYFGGGNSARRLAEAGVHGEQTDGG